MAHSLSGLYSLYWANAVSYTHLDVYKRQKVDCHTQQSTHKITTLYVSQNYPLERETQEGLSLIHIQMCIRDRGYTEDGKAVFDAAFAAVDQVVKDGMGEEEKVKAIHDYLIYHALSLIHIYSGFG